MEIEYCFDFEDGRSDRFRLQFDDASMLLSPESLSTDSIQPWMALEVHRCPSCTLTLTPGATCPVACNLGAIVDRFGDDFSYVVVETVVNMREREIRRKGDLQGGLSSMMGLVMATSGCPTLDYLRPMAYTHQPFATLEETLFRALSGYLVAQYVRRCQQLEPEESLDRLKQVYRDINQVNFSLDKRLREFSGRDANLNALVLLDVFAQMGSFTIDDDWLDQVVPIFASYL